MKTIIITGMGRSGTVWMSEYFRTAPGWLVEHEPHGSVQSAGSVIVDLKKKTAGPHDGYVRVDSYLRHQLVFLLGIPKLVDIVSVVVRNPIDICRSIYNRYGNPRVDHVVEALLSIDSALQMGCVDVIRFDRFTTDLEYRVRAARRLGIPVAASAYPTRTNASRPRAGFEKWLPEILSKTRWFRSIYGSDRLFV